MRNEKYHVYKYTVHTYDRVDSTNDVAKRAIAVMGMSMDCSVHVTGEQTAGHGRQGRVWLNTEGAVMMSIVRITKLGMNRIPILNLVAAAAVRNVIERITDGKADVSIKWPNDVVTSESLEKICGILSEVVQIRNIKYAVIGIGLNLNARKMPGDLLQPATSVYLQSGLSFSVLDTVNLIIKEFDLQYSLLEKDPEAFLKTYAEKCISLGRHVTVIKGDEKRYGVGEKLFSTGQLIVKYEDGSEELIYAADVSLRNQTSIDEKLAIKLRPKRKKASNKRDNGRVLIIAGSDNMPGAALMCTKACIRGGAGLTKVLVPESIKASFALIPEAMLCFDDDKIKELTEWADVILLGCGMGVCKRTEKLLESVLKSGKPCVIDADGLNSLSRHKNLYALLHEKTIVTPHAAEMGRLCGIQTKEVLKEFTKTAMTFASEHRCCVLLKSAGSIIVSPEGEVCYNDTGNSALAKGGSGDVLAGLTAAMLAQGAKPFDAAVLGSYLLGTSAEKAIAFLRNRFTSATDIIDIVHSELQ